MSFSVKDRRRRSQLMDHQRRQPSTQMPAETKWRSWLEQAAPTLVMPMQRQKLNFNAKSRSSKKKRRVWRRRCFKWKRIFRKSKRRSSMENRMFQISTVAMEDVKQEKDPVENSRRTNRLHHDECSTVTEWVRKRELMKQVLWSLKKPGLHKQGDVATRGVFLKKIECRAREELRPKEESSHLHTTDMKVHDPMWLWLQQESSDVAVNQRYQSNLPKESPESFNWNNASWKRVEEEHSPRKDPPSYDKWILALEHHQVFMDKEVTKTTAISDQPSSTQLPLKDYIVPNIV